MNNPKNFIEKLNTSQTLSGLDFGDKTIGVAVSDKSKTIASPILTIKRKGISQDIENLIEIFKEYDVAGVVFGLPLSLSGEENERTIKVRKFAEILSKHTPNPGEGEGAPGGWGGRGWGRACSGFQQIIQITHQIILGPYWAPKGPRGPYRALCA